MSRYTKTQVTQLSANEQAAINNINKNFGDIETAIKDTVSRSGNTPTHMTEDLDMNGKRIINLPAPKTDTDPVRRQDVVGDIALVQNLVSATTNAAAQTLKAASDVQEIIQDANVGLVADDLGLGENSKIRLCGSNIESITDVADDINNINTVSGGLNDISTVSSNIGTISSVADNIAPIGINASQITAITTNADNITAIEYNYDNRSNINSVAENGEIIEDVADNLSAITACAADLPNINSKANISLDNLSTTGEARFSNKVDLDMSNMNPSQLAKKTIVAWGVPNYSAGVTITSPYQVTAPGVIYIQSHKQAATWEGDIQINSVNVYHAETGNSNTQGWGSPLLPVKPNDTVTWTYSRGVDVAVFYPYNT